MQHHVIIETRRRANGEHIATVADGPDFLRDWCVSERTGTDAYTSLRADIRNRFSGVHTFFFVHVEL